MGSWISAMFILLTLYCGIVFSLDIDHVYWFSGHIKEVLEMNIRGI